ncbi:MAG TPA: LacI family DNA-binding transcriptional regulator [Burkholderiales bacterium]|jgi:LacI family transcriptional regulator|nr:LacI family DNA-binding transcriptional regulator [Burkholderiales bacterium]
MRRTSYPKTAKLADVARLARVSTATVSRTLSLPHKVKAATAARINQAVETLGYVAHGAARALASRRTRTIGAVLPTLDNTIFAKTVQALQRTLDQAGYMLLVASDEHDAEAETRVARALIEHGVDGLVLLGTTHHECVLKMLDTHQVPYVLTWALDPEDRHPCVGFDNRAAGVRIARHLLDLGHREFAMISGLTAGNERARGRLRGVREELAAHGIAIAPHRLVEKPYAFAAGREGLREVLGGAKWPTAVICGNDLLAIGALAECHECRIAVPRELSITGFDDMEIADVVTPGLTTIHFPASELGALAAQHLLARLTGQEVAPRTELPVELVVRGSTAPPLLEGRDL